MVPASPCVQTLDGRISGLAQGAKLYIRADATSGYLDPLISILNPDVRRDALSGQSLDEQIKTRSRYHDPIEVTRLIMDRYALAWDDDFQDRYGAALEMETPADGDCWLAIGSSLVRSSAGG